MENNERLSIEKIFNLVEMQHHTIGVSFIPNSISYGKYENGFTVLHVLSMDLETALRNIVCKIFVECSLKGGHFENNIETIGIGYFGKDE